MAGLIQTIQSHRSHRSHIRVCSSRHQPRLHQLPAQPETPWLVDHAEIVNRLDAVEMRELIWPDRWEIWVGGKTQDPGRQPVWRHPDCPGLLAPSSPTNSSGQESLTRPLWSTSQDYQRTRARGVKIEHYHGAPILVGARRQRLPGPRFKIEGRDAGKVGFCINIPDPKGTVEMLESKRRPASASSCSKNLYAPSSSRAAPPNSCSASECPAPRPAPKNSARPTNALSPASGSLGPTPSCRSTPSQHNVPGS